MPPASTSWIASATLRPFQASGIDGIKVRIVSKCDDEAPAERILDAEESLIRRLLGDDDMPRSTLEKIYRAGLRARLPVAG